MISSIAGTLGQFTSKAYQTANAGNRFRNSRRGFDEPNSTERETQYCTAALPLVDGDLNVTVL
jgi:hypothetical protein